MTDNGHNPPRANGYDGQANGAANGRDPDAALMLLDGSPLADHEVGAEESAQESLQEGCGEAETAADTDAVNGTDTDGSGESASEDASHAEEPGTPAVNGHHDEAAANRHAEEGPELFAPEFTDEECQRHMRMAEALLFASAEPLRKEQIAERLPDGADVEQVLSELAEHYAERGVNLVRVAGGWAFRTATDLAFLMERQRVEQRKLSRAALETLAIIAYHQPVTRAEIEDVRGVSVSKGTLDVLMEIGWVRVRGRRQTPGRPVTYGTSDGFLEHFGLDRIGDLPGIDELKAAGLLDTRMPTNISIPRPSDDDGTGEAEETDEDEETPFFDGFGDEDDTRGEGEGTGFTAEDAGDVEAKTADDAPDTEGGPADVAEEPENGHVACGPAGTEGEESFAGAEEIESSKEGVAAEDEAEPVANSPDDCDVPAR